METETRRMLESDVESAGQIIADCYRTLAPRESYTESELRGLLAGCSPEAIRQRYAQYDAYVADNNGQVVGIIAIERNEIAELFVRPDAQGRGIGTLLVNVAEEVMLSSGHDKVRVRSATAPRFYERLGYDILQRRRCDRGPLKGRPLIVFEKRIGRDGTA